MEESLHQLVDGKHHLLISFNPIIQCQCFIVAIRNPNWCRISSILWYVTTASYRIQWKTTGSSRGSSKMGQDVAALEQQQQNLKVRLLVHSVY